MAQPNLALAQIAPTPTSSAKTAWAGAIDTRLITPGQPVSSNLLNAMHEQIFMRFFADDATEETPQIWRDNLAANDGDMHYAFGVSGYNLDSKEPDIAGMSVAKYYKASNTGLMSHMGVNPKHQGKGQGKAMFNLCAQGVRSMAHMHGRKLDGFFVECCDPAKTDPDHDSMDPHTRVQIYKSWGARRIDIDYLCPYKGDTPGSVKTVDYLYLMAFATPDDATYPSPEKTTAFLRDYHKAIGITPDSCTSFKTMQRQLEALRIATQRHASMPSGRKYGTLRAVHAPA